MFTQQKPNPDGGITVLEFMFQKHPQDLPQCVKTEKPRIEWQTSLFPAITFFCGECVSQMSMKKAWIRSHLNTDALHNAYLLYLASSYLCKIKIVISSGCRGRAVQVVINSERSQTEQ